MEIQIKKAVKAGNSSAVILPRAWLNKEVRIELINKTPKTILSETIEILKSHVDLSRVIGIYLSGSYARQEEDENSDIDILVITDDIDKEMITEGIYNILLVSEELLRQKLIKDLFPIGQMIKEAKPLLNSKYLDSIKIEVTKENVKWYLDTTKDKLELLRESLDEIKSQKNKNIHDRIAYTLILRIRTLYIIRKLIENKPYSKKEFIKLIKMHSKGNNTYEGYLAVKGNLKDKKKTSIEEAERLYIYLKNQLEDVKRMVKK